MPSRAAVEQLRSAQSSLARLARRDLRVFLRIAPLEPAALHEALTEFLVDLTRTYGEAAAEVAAEWVEEHLPVRMPARLPLGDTAGREQLARTAGWALRGDLTGDPTALRNRLMTEVAGRLDGPVQRAVQAPGRRTLERTAHAAGIGYARVPTGAETCAFCLMLASRGPVYSKDSATRTKDGRRYHDDCSCVPVPVASEDDYPEGYDPDALYEQYEHARSQAGGNTDRILAQMRQDLGVR